MLRYAGVLALVLMFATNAHSAKPVDLPIPLGENYPVEVMLNQQEIAVNVSATNAMAAGGGMLGALIVAGVDNARTKAAEERITPLRNLLIEYRFNEAMEQAIREKIPSTGISSLPAFNFQKSGFDALDAQNNLQLPAQSLVLTPEYFFDNKFNEMTVKVTAQVINRTIKPNGKLKIKQAFNRIYSFHFILPKPGEVDANVAAWESLGGDLLKSILDLGVQQSIDMITFDFSADGRAQWGTSDRRAKATLGDHTFAGITLRETPQWVWTRSGKGMFQALNGYSVAAPMPTSASHPQPNNGTPEPDATGAQP